jgi:predicted RNase H-like nuclease
MEKRWIAGVDGCRGGWVAVFRAVGSGDAETRRVDRFAELLEDRRSPEIIAVDMPIGLPDRIMGGGRGPEQALRPHLGQRQSSVFAIPARAAVFAEDYREACDLAFAASDPPRRISKQAFFLFPKIREIDALLRERPELRERVVESHPEGAFVLMNGGRPLAEPKKVKGGIHEPGLAERRALLAGAGFGMAFLAAKPPAGVGRDDYLDACACAHVAARIVAGTARSFPESPRRDAYGIPIRIMA